MRPRTSPLIVLVATCLLALCLLSGCGKSAPTHFYALSPAEAPPLDGPPCYSVGIGPVEIPAYLDRRDVVTREGGARVKLAEFESWAEPVKDGLARVLAENLSGLVCARPIAVYPWPTGVNPEYQVTVQAQRFDGALKKDVVLRASWSILNGDGELLVWKLFESRAPAGDDYASMAASMSDLAATLSRDIAMAIKEFQR